MAFCARILTRLSRSIYEAAPIDFIDLRSCYFTLNIACYFNQ